MAAEKGKENSKIGKDQTATLQEMQRQIQALQAKIADLQARQEAQADAQVETAKAVNDVQVASAKPADELTRKLDALNKLVDNTHVGGTMFFDVTSQSHKEATGISSLVKKDGHGSTNGTGFDVKRFYLTVDHKFDDVWSANLTTDFNYQVSIGQTSLFVKKAYVQGKFDGLFTVRFGAADMPWIPFVEKWYGYRFVENTITDRSFEGGRSGGTATAGGVGAFGNSSDWGIHALGATTGGNSISYQLSVVNGRGYRNLSRSKSVDTEARFGYSPIEQMVIAVGGYSGKRGYDTEGGAPTRTATRGDALLAWRDKTWGAGVEYFHTENWDDILRYAGTGAGPNPATNSTKDKADGYSAWADWHFYDQFAVFGRYDRVDYKYDNLTSVEEKLKDRYYNAGVSYDVLKNLKLALVYKHNKLDGPVATPYHYKTNEVGVWGMLTF
ncbi:FlxA-like family protein [Luteibacter aegosomatissinici]|uniref:FlxA-like family protein n=1 Tax=Luteibacter aegosomatissinici TaxID=2911539 RepID=UPI001FF7BB83|nr:FlxA-like family protein [Luteibacter aegosomatissinici]UPG92716.1 FlxA-like family protein [Luteibacter aegosomatissinici]